MKLFIAIVPQPAPQFGDERFSYVRKDSNLVRHMSPISQCLLFLQQRPQSRPPLPQLLRNHPHILLLYVSQASIDQYHLHNPRAKRRHGPRLGTRQKLHLRLNSHAHLGARRNDGHDPNALSIEPERLPVRHSQKKRYACFSEDAHALGIGIRVAGDET